MDEDRADRLDIVQELFALLTTLSEDAADAALNGQICDDPAEIVRLADRVREAGNRMMIIAKAVEAMPLL